ncbi:DUF624 domain-containing protein [Neobacillus drentensis]|uniref:YesL family protein n=1 Tax=Neobacillus drentensis TaxID=220684 RepID=UPI002FFFC5E8
MNILDNKLYNRLNTIVDFIILNLLWVLMCLPIVTIFPATAALFGVVRKWNMKEEPPILKTYFQLFKDNFFQSMLIGFIWAFVGASLYLDFQLTSKNLLMKLLLVIIFSIYSITSIYLFPVMVHYKNTSLRIIKNSFFLAILKPIHLLFAILVIISSYIIVSHFPIILIFSASLTAYLIYMICYKAFQKAEEINANTIQVKGS